MRFGIAMAAMALVSGGVLAGEPASPKAMAMQVFHAADTDGDGRLSAAEHATARLERYGVAFEQMDLDQDGAVSVAEYVKIFEAHHPPDGQPA